MSLTSTLALSLFIEYIMFWIQTIKSGDKFWHTFQIIQPIAIAPLLQVYVAPLDGIKTLLFSLRHGETQLSQLQLNFTFAKNQHVAFVVHGGCIKIIGTRFESAVRDTSDTSKYKSDCAFFDDVEWRNAVVEILPTFMEGYDTIFSRDENYLPQRDYLDNRHVEETNLHLFKIDRTVKARIISAKQNRT